MSLRFDEATADQLIRSAESMMEILLTQGFGRRLAAENAADDFSGQYAQLFFEACNTEASDRGRLVAVLDELCRQVREAKQKAKEEEQRQAALAAWEERDAKRRFAQTSSPGGGSFYDPWQRFSDPKPTDSPVVPPTLTAVFSPVHRIRYAGIGSSSSTSSANPQRLRGFVASSRPANSDLLARGITLGSAKSRFKDACAWVPWGADSVVPGLVQLVEENDADAAWIERIATAFDEAGGGGELSDFVLSLTTTGDQPSDFQRFLRSGPLGAEQITLVAAYLKNHPELADQAGQFVASTVRLLDVRSSKDDITQATLLLNGLSGDPKVSAAILDRLNGDGLIKALTLAGSRAYRSGVAPDGSTYHTASGDPLYAEFGSALRTVFRSGEPALSPEKSRELAGELIDYLEADLKMPGAYQAARKSGDLEAVGPYPLSPYAVSYLLRGSTLSTPFLGELGVRLDRLERQADDLSWTWEPDNSAGGLESFFDQGTPRSGYDPLSAYLSALGHNGEAALQFFTGAGAERAQDQLTEAQALDRQKYWIEQRRWGHDDFDGLLGALDAATTSPGNLDDPESMKLVSTSFEMLANRTQGKDAEGHAITFGADEKVLPGTLGADASRHLAHIFGTYMEAVDYHVNEPPDVRTHIGKTITDEREDFSGPMVFPRLNTKDLALLVKAGLSTEEGFIAFREAVARYQDVHIAQVVQNHYGTPVFAEATNYDAGLEAFFMKNLGDVTIANGLKKDEQVGVWIGLGSDLMGQVPLGKIPAGGTVIDILAGQAVGAGQEALTEYLAHHEKDAITDANEFADQALSNRRNAIVGALYNNNVITRFDVEQTAAKLGISPDDVSRWFADGFPDSKMILTDEGDLRSLVSALSRDRFDVNRYRQNYKDQFRGYFE